ncbi:MULTISPECIES: hypothetical protein [Sphingomonadaceae]|uniref:hypothetical protein n=2 Tax=Pseudomonadota TaxID=1224 RepID=UPI00076A4CE0|nr:MULTISPECIES: hypothetical protein [Sphingomonadaceae]MAF59893.1 hypothetical protein [Blastomonas sp.]MBA4045793.1 hypothetical protein [Erythrobacter sp.]
MTMEKNKSENGKCPSCGAHISFFYACFKKGQPFACKACGTELIVAKKTSLGLVLAGIALGSFLGKEFGLFAVILVVIMLGIYEWLTARVTTAVREQMAINA